MAGISGISGNRGSQIANFIHQVEQDLGINTKGAGQSQAIGQELQQLISMLQGLEGGSSAKAAPTHVAW